MQSWLFQAQDILLKVVETEIVLNGLEQERKKRDKREWKTEGKRGWSLGMEPQMQGK